MKKKWYALIICFTVIVAIAVSSLKNHEFTISPLQLLKGSSRWYDKIQDGIALLKASPPLQFVDGVKQQTALAIFDKKTGELSEERIWISTNGEILSSALPIRIAWWNGFNSVYEINSRPELVIVANKFLVERKYLPEQKTLKLALDAPQSKYTDMVYAPYSESLHWPDVIVAGKEYINTHADEAFKELKEARIQSRAQPGKLIVDVIPKDLVKNIVLVEHVDPGWLMVADDGGKSLTERALVIIGANQEWAYRYTNSTAGANGIAQFIESTYDLLVKRYPDAGLIKNRTLGMADHTNAFKAITLLFDNDANDIQSKTEAPATREMLAAAYNGGSTRVIQAVKKHGQTWADSAIFPTETSDYVKKYEAIKKLKIF